MPVDQMETEAQQDLASTTIDEEIYIDDEVLEQQV